eukprot:jgi/Botrbrau1/17932/Bobra.50_1s0032.2
MLDEVCKRLCSEIHGISMKGKKGQLGVAVLLVLLFALTLRITVGLHSYSGANTPPRYGDYEAQRHWMEVTVHTPMQEWYTNTTANDLEYWGIDYPPLSGYQSWACGVVIGAFQPEAVALHTSRGHETASSKILLRWSVLAFDLLVFVPAVLACGAIFLQGRPPEARVWMLVASLLQPAAVLIDHGHFQYNNISLGLSAGAAAAIAAGHHLLGAALYCLALNHKQMAMYYAPAFFAHLLGTCLQRRGLPAKVWGVARLGLVVISTFIIVWSPWLRSPELAWGLLSRLVPVRRGLYEDYVANFWCATALVVKWKRLFTQQALVKMCGGITLLAAAPSMLQQMMRPSPQGLLMGMANSAFAFFLFSYQVHEKSVMLSLLPLTLLADSEPGLASWLPAVAAFSMYPLLRKDGLSLAYLGTLMIWAALTLPDADVARESGRTRPKHAPAKKAGGRRLAAGAHAGHGSRLPELAPWAPWTGSMPDLALWAKKAVWASVALAALVHVLDVCWTPPARYPFLIDYMVISLSFLHIMAAALYMNWRQWHPPDAHQVLKVE